MSFPCPCSGCNRYATEWAVCRSCAARLERDLSAIPALAAQVTLTLTRQSVQAPRNGSRATEKPLAFDVRASNALSALRIVLVGWSLVLIEEGAHPYPHDSEAGCAHWLLARTHVLRTHEAAGDICSEIAEVVSACWRVIDRAPMLWFAGPCDHCARPMYAKADALGITCAGCAATYDIRERRAQLLDAARDEQLTIADMLRVLPQWIGVPLNDSTMRSWHRRGRMMPVGVNLNGRETFRVGDVLDLVEGVPRAS